VILESTPTSTATSLADFIKNTPVYGDFSGTIKSFLTFIRVHIIERGTLPPTYDNEPIEEYLFYGDGRGIKEERGRNVTLEVLEKYKTECMIQFTMANICIRKLQVSGISATAKYKNGEQYRIIRVEGGMMSYGVGDRFIVSANQELTKGEKVKGYIHGRNVTVSVSQTNIIEERKK
jgi:hypothetical protein